MSTTKEQIAELLHSIEGRDTVAFFAVDLARTEWGAIDPTFSVVADSARATPQQRDRFHQLLRDFAALLRETFPPSVN